MTLKEQHLASPVMLLFDILSGPIRKPDSSGLEEGTAFLALLSLVAFFWLLLLGSSCCFCLLHCGLDGIGAKALKD
jgi:hypothetical protein